MKTAVSSEKSMCNQTRVFDIMCCYGNSSEEVKKKNPYLVSEQRPNGEVLRAGF